MSFRLVSATVLALSLLVASSTSAGNITAEQATRAAENYLTFQASVDTWDGGAIPSVQLERTLTWDGEIIGYYFEVDPDGWLLIPAYRELPPIKAYAEHGRLDFDHPESLGAIFEGILSDKAATITRYPDIDSMADAGIDTSAVNRYGELWDIFTLDSRNTFFESLSDRELDEYTPGTYMIQSSWHQGAPYNNYCPQVDQLQCWVGCAATAMAQIMNYWQWPPHGIGGHSYIWEGQTLSANFSDAYDWSNILPSYGQPGDHTLEELDAIAELSYEVGVSLEMNYGLDGSGILLADIDIVMTALSDYFGYQDIMDIEYRNQYANVDDWFAVLQQDLDLERPMWYYIYGHVIVCDGWRISNTINQIHINYGVGGAANSWYGLDEIPGSINPQDERVIRHIEPLESMPPAIEWQEQIVTDNFDAATSVHAADVDGDGDMDVIGAAYIADRVTWWENVGGDGTLWNEQIVDAAFNGARSVHAADVDGDGDTDILGAASNDNLITWWKNVDGSGTLWTERVAGALVSGATSVFAADVDGDGDTDILGAAYDGDSINWWENLSGTGLSWAGHTVDAAFDGANSVSAADIDGDGDMDIVGSAFFAQDITWWENLDGTGLNWAVHVVDALFAGAADVHAADIDGDGDTDLLGAGSIADEIRCWENMDGAGTSWIAHSVSTGFNGAGSVYTDDFDNDGDLDVIGSAYYSDDISCWENPNSFGINWTCHRVGWMFDGANDVCPTDIDNDGDMDLIGAAYIGDEIAIWTQAGSPGPPDPITINIIPAVIPTIVPRGGWFEYDLQMSFNVDQPALGYIWTSAILPNGQSYGPIFDVQFIFAPGMSLDVAGIQQEVPVIAPLGDYIWTVSAGPSLLNPTASDSFPFTVIAANMTSDGDLAEWSSNGEQLILVAADEYLNGSNAVATKETLLPEYSVTPAYPNPFNAATMISVSLPETADLSVQVFNIAGQLVATLMDGSTNAGTHRFTFGSSELASGLYFVRAYVPGNIDQTQKIMLIR